MKKLILLLFFATIALNAETEFVHHSLNVEIDHSTFEINVVDTIYNYEKFIDQKGKLIFDINESFKNISIEGIQDIETQSKFLFTPDVLLSTVIVDLNNYEKDYLIFKYSGIFRKPAEKQTKEYSRAGTEYAYMLNEQGAYLSYTSAWYPRFQDQELVTFDLAITSNSKYDFVSQGELEYNKVSKGTRECRFKCNDPMDNIYLVSGPFTTFEEEFDGIKVQAYLRSNDQKLAMKYIKSTERFLDMYNNLIGDYPYTKFTLVENHEQTGWGMPSFTLLGSKIIRFPFILYSSYPHELLHNWWGNSVYVDYEYGNWCEGLTSYLADHLIKEQGAKGSEYRKDALERYTFYVSDGLDYEVRVFKSKDGSVSEAIGYSKVLMIFHMLRVKYGDEVFKNFLSSLYKQYKFKHVSFKQLFDVFESVSGDGLDSYFEQWILKDGAPVIEMNNVNLDEINGNFVVSFEIDQKQPFVLFNVDVPVYIQVEGKTETVKKVINVSKKNELYSFSFDAKPEVLQIDPLYDVMRKMHPNESAPIISNLFGDNDSYIILPSKSKNIDDYKKMAEQWQVSQRNQSKRLNILMDNEIENIPSHAAVWIFGKENLHIKLETFEKELDKYTDQSNSSEIKNYFNSNSGIVVFKNPENNAKAIGYLSTNDGKALAALARKLPHYGKYSFLGFEGAEAENKLKGVFQVTNNPMIYKFNDSAEIIKIEEHEPLIK
jgi:hypothetical protein